MAKEISYQEVTSQARKPTASSPASQLLISVIISARDVANSISSLIPKIKESLSGYHYEIVLVDDGSVDATREIAKSNGTVVVSHQKSLGKGAAMKTGVQNSSGDILVFLDGDGAHNPQDIPRVIAPILERKNNFVIGSRSLPESKIPRAPLTRRLSNNLASLIISATISLLLPLATRFKHPIKWTKVTDCTSGFRAMERAAWQKLHLTSQGFEIETEMIYEAAKNELAIAEAPISCSWDNQFSRLSVLKDGLRTLKLLVRKLLGIVGGG